MTAKEKAKELISKFTFLTYPESDSKFYNPKQCAIIVVDEIIENLNWLEDSINFDKAIRFWQEVKSELEKL